MTEDNPTFTDPGDLGTLTVASMTLVQVREDPENYVSGSYPDIYMIDTGNNDYFIKVTYDSGVTRFCRAGGLGAATNVSAGPASHGTVGEEAAWRSDVTRRLGLGLVRWTTRVRGKVASNGPPYGSTNGHHFIIR